VLYEPLSCHNCTEVRDRTVVFYPNAGKVVVLEGTHGYDS
jgi:hypothetical protein